MRDLFLPLAWDTLTISTIRGKIGEPTRTVGTRQFSGKIMIKQRSIKVRRSIKQGSILEEYREIRHTKRGSLSGTRAGALGTFRVTPEIAENGISAIMAGSTVRTAFKQPQAKTMKMSLSCGFEKVEALPLADMRIRHRQGSAAETRLSVVYRFPGSGRATTPVLI